MLKNIISQVFGPLGLNPQVEADRLLLVSKINTAAKELWEQTDLIGSLREQFFQPTITDQEISLPFYVAQVRGVRNNGWSSKIDLHDMSPRYYYGAGWQSANSWRVKPKSVLNRTISNSAPMTISVPAAESTRVTFHIRGSTANAHRASEVAILEAGETEVTLTKSFTDIVGFYKDVVTEGDVSLTDADGNVVSVIPNVLEEAQHCVLQLVDVSLTEAILTENVYEILYKLLSIPMVDDYDSFTVPDYDDAIVWKTLSHFYATKEGQEGLALGYGEQCNQLVDKRDIDAGRGLIKPVQTLPNKYIRAMSNHANWYGRGRMSGAY